MSWQQLAAKRFHCVNGASQPYFTPAEIQAGMHAAATAVSMAKESEKQAAPSTTTSPSDVKSTND